MNHKTKLYNILTSNNVVESIQNHLPYLLSIISEIKDMIGFEHQHPHHHLDVWNHTLLAISLSENIFDIRLVLLLHDIGKPHSYQEGTIRHFKNHPYVSAHMSKEILKRLEYNKEYINNIVYLIEKHDYPINKCDVINNYDLEYQRYLVQQCDIFAHHPDKLTKRKEYLYKV